MTIVIRLHRTAGDDTASTYVLPSPEEAGISASDWSGVSVSSALQYLQRAVDPALAFSLSCRRGLCNVCAMRIDGVVTTACTTPMRDGILIEPARSALLLRDTVIELSLVRRSRVDSVAALEGERDA
ncbi:2Fe-2S iron-sulfur cluster-binding protein [Caballeronia sordidicola]|nr:2Fe-2S iron-sulfur cluster-binding protein [Caballeronia sordidicola]